MMTIVHSTLKAVAVLVACASIAACADRPSRQEAELNYRSDSSATAQGARSTGDPSDQRLTIQSGSGAKLNLPWFIRDTQDLINSN